MEAYTFLGILTAVTILIIFFWNTIKKLYYFLKMKRCKHINLYEVFDNIYCSDCGKYIGRVENTKDIPK